MFDFYIVIRKVCAADDDGKPVIVLERGRCVSVENVGKLCFIDPKQVYVPRDATGAPEKHMVTHAYFPEEQEYFLVPVSHLSDHVYYDSQSLWLAESVTLDQITLVKVHYNKPDKPVTLDLEDFASQLKLGIDELRAKAFSLVFLKESDEKWECRE